MSPFKNLRPDCEKLLNDKSLWALDVISIQKLLKKLTNNEVTIEESFI
jgi:hypothetical protein